MERKVKEAFDRVGRSLMWLIIIGHLWITYSMNMKAAERVREAEQERQRQDKAIEELDKRLDVIEELRKPQRGMWG